MFDQTSQDQQQSQQNQPAFTPPGMAPLVDHSLPMVSPDPSSAPNLDNTVPGLEPQLAHSEPAPISGHSDSNHDDPLMAIKREALQQLTPLVGHLEQTPEEKFRTTMMMIQASDDHSLIQTAYDAAQNIEDEKVRAQALLDVINEINYFTQQNKTLV